VRPPAGTRSSAVRGAGRPAEASSAEASGCGLESLTLLLVQQREQLLSDLPELVSELLTRAAHDLLMALRRNLQDRPDRFPLLLVPGLDDPLDVHDESALSHLRDARYPPLLQSAGDQGAE
jgi:hypothetical protein